MSVLLADIAIDLGEVDHFEFNDIWRILFKDIRNMGGAAWDLKGCCGPEESIFLAFYAGYGLIFFFINSWAVMKPMRLLSVFVHEFGHASACWLTGGKVKKD
mmetsp:Transcript_21007/g.27148  ORF Transcript_21007/g.27148 Transcript_21007/m.27148 type:complete len:102 (-) Transcript_21007:1141-1446(-)